MGQRGGGMYQVLPPDAFLAQQTSSQDRLFVFNDGVFCDSLSGFMHDATPQPASSNSRTTDKSRAAIVAPSAPTNQLSRSHSSTIGRARVPDQPAIPEIR